MNYLCSMQISTTFARVITTVMGVIKHCPRCGAEFTCKAEDKWHCQCAQVKLSASVCAYLSAHYTDCLCVKCLQELSQQV